MNAGSKSNRVKLDLIYSEAKKKLKSLNDNNCFVSNSDIIQLMQFCFQVSKEDILLGLECSIETVRLNKFWELFKLRMGGYPLQYILGEWEIDGLKFKVGPGVLIPREDTLALVELTENFINLKYERGTKLRILDLCAGSGLISIILAKKFPLADVMAVELSDIALYYLKNNIISNKALNTKIIKANVLQDPPKFLENVDFDILLSNPPYIPSSELNSLQKEVTYEPKIALDGGADGLLFYRGIVKHWTNLLTSKRSALMAFEVGDEIQAASVANMLENLKLGQVNIGKDINNLSRVVFTYV